MPSLHQHTLPSGLRVIGELDPRGYSASIGFFVRAGSRDETDRQSGLSHFLEHMMFKGTANRTASDVNRELDELGGQANAYTSEEQTVYYTTVLPKFQHRTVDLLSDMLTPSLDEDEFATEKQVILEEIAKYEDQPPFGAFERSMERFFGPRGLGRRILGSKESITEMTANDLRGYFHHRYRPDNIVVAVTGNVDFDSLIEQLENATATWRDRPDSDPLPPDAPEKLPPGISMQDRWTVAGLNQSYVVRLGDGPAASDEDRYAARMLAAIVGDEGGSRLYWDLIDTGRAEVATCWPQEFTDRGVWFSYLVCDPDDVDSNLRLMDEAMERVSTDGVNEAELRQTRNKAIAVAIKQSERPINRLFGVGSRYLVHREYFSLDETLDRIRSLTVDDVNRAARKYLVPPKEIVQVTPEGHSGSAEGHSGSAEG